MTIDELRQIVYARFVAQWGTTTAYILDGEKGDEPGPGVEWVRVSVQETAGGQETLGGVGNRKFERDFSTFLQIFTPATKGTQPGASHAHTGRGIFEGVRLDAEAWCNGAVVTTEPLREGAKSRQTNVEIFGKYTETK